MGKNGHEYCHHKGTDQKTRPIQNMAINAFQFFELAVLKGNGYSIDNTN